jgi:hypothetical protein
MQTELSYIKSGARVEDLLGNVLEYTIATGYRYNMNNYTLEQKQKKVCLTGCNYMERRTKTKRTTLGIPTWSRTVVLTEPDDA